MNAASVAIAGASGSMRRGDPSEGARPLCQIAGVAGPEPGAPQPTLRRLQPSWPTRSDRRRPAPTASNSQRCPACKQPRRPPNALNARPLAQGCPLGLRGDPPPGLSVARMYKKGRGLLVPYQSRRSYDQSSACRSRSLMPLLASNHCGGACSVALKAPAKTSKPAASTSCLLYTSPSPRDEVLSRMPSSA